MKRYFMYAVFVPSLAGKLLLALWSVYCPFVFTTRVVSRLIFNDCCSVPPVHPAVPLSMSKLAPGFGVTNGRSFSVTCTVVGARPFTAIELSSFRTTRPIVVPGRFSIVHLPDASVVQLPVRPGYTVALAST